MARSTAESSRRLGVEPVFREIGRQRQDLIAWGKQSVAEDRQGGGGAGGQIKILRPVAYAKGGLQPVCKLLPDECQPRGRRIAMQLRGRHGLQQTADALRHAGRRRNAGTADGKVKHIFRAHLLGAPVAISGDLPDDAPLGAPIHHFLRDHTFTSNVCFKKRMACT